MKNSKLRFVLWIGVVFIILSMSIFSCTKIDKNSPPNIGLIGFLPAQVQNSNNADSVVFFLSYSDAGGDFANGDYTTTPNSNNIIFKDLRFPDKSVAFAIPTILDSSNSVSIKRKGNIQTTMPNSYLPKRSDTIHSEIDTVQFEIYVIDGNGNQSNSVMSEKLFITK